jgi:steroid 5-alpha reductase family enzyme
MSELTGSGKNVHAASAQPSADPDPSPTNQSQTFDTMTAMAAMMLWLIFGFMTPLLSCDIQRLMTNNIFAKHIMSFILFFFLMAVIDTSNTASLGKTWLKALYIYILFMFAIKSKLAASMTVIIILVIDQSIRLHMDYKKRNNDTKNLDKYETVRKILFVALILVVAVGYIMYMIRAMKEHGDDFSQVKLFFGTNKCNMGA